MRYTAAVAKRRGRCVFGNLVVWYLFLGGVSGGAALVALAVEFLAYRLGGGWRSLSCATRRPLLVSALVIAVMGCMCLLGDLRRPEMAHLLFVSPTGNIMNVGAILLALYLAALVVLVASPVPADSCTAASPWKRLVHHCITPLAAVLAAAVITYTGLYLHSFWTVAPWGSPLLVVLFALSSLSCGVAVLYVAVLFAKPNATVYRHELACVERADLALIALEALALVAVVAQLALVAQNTSLPSPFPFLTDAPLAAPFWLGFVVCALVLPPVAHGAHVRFGARLVSPPVHLVAMSASLLVGGFFLRYCMINLPALYKASMLAGM